MKRLKKPESLIFLFYFVVSAFATWSLLLHFRTSIYGYPGDNIAGVWTMWWMRTGGSSFCPIIGYPFGTHLNLWSFDILNTVFYRVLLVPFNEVVVANLEVFLSFFLSGVIMYYLVKHIFKDRRVAFLGGFAFMLVPYHANLSLYMIGGIISLQWMPLYVLTLLKFIEDNSIKRGVYLGLSALLVAGTSIQNGLAMGVFTLAFLLGLWIFRFVRSEKTSFNWRTFAIAGVTLTLIILLVVLPALLSLTSQSKEKATGVPTSRRTEKSAYWGSAVATNYFLPNNSSPLFKSFKSNLIIQKLNWFSSIYLGWVVIILAVFAFIWRTSNRKYFWGFFTAVIMGILFSLPAFYHGIPMPSLIFRLIAPWFRWYMRIGTVAILSMILLACYGLNGIFGKLKKESWKYYLLVPVSILLALEFLIVPPFRNYSLKEPRLYGELADLPKKSALAFYPIYESGKFINSQLMFFNRNTGKPMLNGAYNNSDGEILRRTVFNPYDPQTPGILRRYGITHAVFFENQFDFKPELLPSGFKQKLAFVPGDQPKKDDYYADTLSYGNSYVSKITSPKAEIFPLYLGEISVPVPKENRQVSRALVSNGTIRVMNYGKEKPVRFELPVYESYGNYDVTVTAGGRILWKGSFAEHEENGMIDFNFTVPEKRLDLDIVVKGKPASLTDLWSDTFGTERITMEIGSATIKP